MNEDVDESRENKNKRKKKIKEEKSVRNFKQNEARK